MITAADIANTGMPLRVFLFTLDQIATMMNVPQVSLEKRFIWFEGRSVGVKHPRKMSARNIEPDETAKPDWRVADKEVIRWMKLIGFVYVERGYVKS